MKASELITQLQSLINTHGDLPIVKWEIDNGIKILSSQDVIVMADFVLELNAHLAKAIAIK